MEDEEQSVCVCGRVNKRIKMVKGGGGVGRFMLRKEEGSVWFEVILCDVETFRQNYRNAPINSQTI